MAWCSNKWHRSGSCAKVYCWGVINFMFVFFLTVRMGSFAMDMQALQEKGLLWKTSMRLESMVLMEKLLACLECLTVRFALLQYSYFWCESGRKFEGIIPMDIILTLLAFHWHIPTIINAFYVPERFATCFILFIRWHIHGCMFRPWWCSSSRVC